jgi:hypothetical protein
MQITRQMALNRKWESANLARIFKAGKRKTNELGVMSSEDVC